MRDFCKSEEAYLQELVSQPVRVFLMNGCCLRGRLEGASESAIFLTDESAVGTRPLLIFKGSIASIGLEEDRMNNRRGHSEGPLKTVVAAKEIRTSEFRSAGRG